MASSKQLVTKINILGGLESTIEPHLVAEDKWIQHHNVQPFLSNISQVQHQVLLAGALSSADEVQTVVSIPTEKDNEVLMVALTPTRAFQLNLDDLTLSEMLYLTEYKI